MTARVLLAVLALLLSAAPSRAQLRPLEPVDFDWLDGDWTAEVRLGASVLEGQPASVSGVEGRLYEIGLVELAWRIGGVVVGAGGTAWRRLEVESRSGEPLPGITDRDDRLEDVGVVRVATLIPLASGPDVRAALRFGARLPVNELSAGLERDRTDFFATVGGSVRGGPLRASAEAGVGINGTHSGEYRQVDVLIYAARVEHRADWLRTRFTLVGRLEGLEGHTVRGNEDLQEARLGVRAGRSRWLEVEVVRGLRAFSPDRGLRVLAGARF